MKKEFQIQNRTVNQDDLFIIAEVGNQFGGDLQIAKDLVDATAYAGADAIKFIFWFPDEILASKTEPMYTYMSYDRQITEPMYEMLERLRLTGEEWIEVKRYCDKSGVIMMSTVLSPGGIDLADFIGLPAIKISSWDYNYTQLWEWCSKMAVPLFIDTGPCELHELAKNIAICKKNDCSEIVLLHTFHTQIFNENNMLSIPYLGETFDCLTGYSAAGQDSKLDIMAVALGAIAIEKRVTISRKNSFLHSSVSLEPEEFKEYVRDMRDMKASLGKKVLKPSQNDRQERKKWFRHLVADRDMNEGELILYGDLGARRGEEGVSPEYEGFFVSRVVKRDIKKNEPIKWGDV